MPYELVNHSQNEIVTPRGITTNGIPAKWRVLRRWSRNRYAGQLRKGTDRTKSARLIGEFRFQKSVEATHVRARADVCQLLAFDNIVLACLV